MRCPQPNEALMIRSWNSRCSFASLVTSLTSTVLSAFTVASRWRHSRCLRRQIGGMGWRRGEGDGEEGRKEGVGRGKEGVRVWGEGGDGGSVERGRGGVRVMEEWMEGENGHERMIPHFCVPLFTYQQAEQTPLVHCHRLPQTASHQQSMQSSSLSHTLAFPGHVTTTWDQKQ